MKTQIEKDPIEPVGKRNIHIKIKGNIRDQVDQVMMKTSKQIYRMPKICWSTLNAFRRKLHSSIPKDQDDFVSTILDKIEFKFLIVTKFCLIDGRTSCWVNF